MAKTDYMIIYEETEVFLEAVHTEKESVSRFTAYFDGIRTGRESDE